MDRRLLLALRPVLRYSPSRNAYVLRLVGARYGPVLREERRRSADPELWRGIDRRDGRTA